MHDGASMIYKGFIMVHGLSDVVVTARLRCAWTGAVSIDKTSEVCLSSWGSPRDPQTADELFQSFRDQLNHKADDHVRNARWNTNKNNTNTLWQSNVAGWEIFYQWWF
jgi:hypothetical protein